MDNQKTDHSRCWFCGDSTEELIQVNTEKDKATDKREVEACVRCFLLKKDRPIDKFRLYLKQSLEELKKSKLVGFFINIEVFLEGNPEIIFYGEDLKFGARTKQQILKYIREGVCEYFEIDEEDFFSKTRKREVVWARQIAQYFGKKIIYGPLAMIGSECGGKDHATVLWSVKQVMNLYDTDKEKREEIKTFAKKFNVVI